jgi:AraC-like DNA-binding protein
MKSQTRIIFQNNASLSPLGSVKLAGFIKQSHGKGQGKQRRLGSYALVYSLNGGCSYRDEHIGHRTVEAGDLIILFPEIAHRYGTGSRGHWDEFFMVFDGPIFDLWRTQGLLNPDNPILHLEPVAYWQRRLESCLDTHGTIGWTAALQQICNLQTVLTEILGHTTKSLKASPKLNWLETACGILGDGSMEPMDMNELAGAFGLSFETFRKKFTQIMGMSPMRYRAARAMDRASELILEGGMTGKQIAEQLGFSDEYHFSKRFKQVTGLSPSGFRRQMHPTSEV